METTVPAAVRFDDLERDRERDGGDLGDAGDRGDRDRGDLGDLGDPPGHAVPAAVAVVSSKS